MSEPLIIEEQDPMKPEPTEGPDEWDPDDPANWGDDDPDLDDTLEIPEP